MAEHIQAKTFSIDGMHLGRMVTRQGDLAYHFLRKDESKSFQEGWCLVIFSSILCHLRFFAKWIELCIFNALNCTTITDIICDFFYIISIILYRFLDL